jgi:hypothetical protein
MLRYSIERLDEREKKKYLNMSMETKHLDFRRDF